MERPTLHIVDGHSQVFKAYHAIRQLTTSTGVPTNATYGFVQILQKLLRTRNPGHLLVAFDSGGPTFRHEIYPAYKANRAEAPEDLSLQMGQILRILDGMHVPIIQLQGFEADDIIATVTRRALDDGFDVVIVTADKDLFQLVGDHVRVLRLDPDKEIEFDREGVREKMGVYPERILDLLAMVGDSSDNIPGIHKVGPKTALALLEQYDSLDGVLANADKLKGKQRENVEAGRESAKLSRQLATLDENVPISFKVEDFRRRPPDMERLAEIYQELEFRRLLDDVKGAPPVREAHYSLVCSAEQLAAVAADIRAAGVVAIDTETDSLSTLTANLVGISLSCKPDEAFYIPILHAGTLDTVLQQLTVDEIFPTLDPILRDGSILKLGHNLKFDRKILMKHGFAIESPSFDTLLASYILNPDKRGHGLKQLAGDLLGIRMNPITDLIGTGRDQITFAQVELDKACTYAAADADATLQLHTLLAPRLDESGMRTLYDQVEMPLIDVLIDMELCGVVIDSCHFSRLSGEMGEELARISGRIFELVGHPFNLGSPKQVAQVLFEELGLKPSKQKKTGYSTDVDVLDELSPVHEVPRLLLEYRQYEKLKGTYVDVLPTLVDSQTRRIHTTYNQTVAATGRLSSSDPNLQNIPVRTALGRRIREGFLPSKTGNVLLSADYSQIELRVLAHVSRDAALVRAFREDADIHALTAAKVFGVELPDVTPEMRDQAKVVNFGIIYGISAHGLGQRLKLPVADAQAMIDEYFALYEGVKAWVGETLEFARANGFVTTISGRRRYLSDINSQNFNARSAAERVAVNAPVQGSSADMIKLAMIAIHRWLREANLRTTMIMQVHDELIFDVPEGELELVTARVCELMRDALPLDVPVTVVAGHGANWAEC